MQPASTRAKLQSIFLNNLACYVLAWLLVSGVYQGAQVWRAHRADVPGRWELAGPRFTLPNSGWTQPKVLAVYGTGPLLALALAVVAFGVFWGRQRFRPGLGKALLLWVSFVALNQVAGGLLADAVLQTGWWYVPNWLLGTTGTWPGTALGLLLAAAQLALGYALAIPWLLAQDSRTLLQFDNRYKLIAYTLLGPWLAGSALLLLSKLPRAGLPEALHDATLGLLLVPLALGLHRPFQGERQMMPRPTHVAWGLVALALLGLLAWRLALGGAGVRV